MWSFLHTLSIFHRIHCSEEHSLSSSFDAFSSLSFIFSFVVHLLFHLLFHLLLSFVLSSLDLLIFCPLLLNFSSLLFILSPLLLLSCLLSSIFSLVSPLPSSLFSFSVFFLCLLSLSLSVSLSLALILCARGAGIHGNVLDGNTGGRERGSSSVLLTKFAHVGLSRASEVHQRNPWIFPISKFENKSRTTCSRFLQSFALPDEAVKLQFS